MVYANPLAWDAINRSLKQFPEGSILVREKLSSDDKTKIDLLAVMIKRESGYNPAGGDWQFLVSDGPMTKLTRNEKKGQCLDCHQSQKSTDFVYPLK